MADPTASEGFVHLRVRSAYSLLEGAIKADLIGKLAAEGHMPAAGLTDRANLFGALEFSSYTKDAGVQPIIGCALPVVGIGEGQSERWARMPTITLLAQDEQGYLNLTALSSACYLEPASDREPSVDWDRVCAHAAGLILLSGGVDGPVNLAAPNPLPNREFMRALREAWAMPNGLPAPAPLLALGMFFLRTEPELVLKSRRVVPRKLLNAGFEFNFPSWPEAAEDLVRQYRGRS